MLYDIVATILGWLGAPWDGITCVYLTRRWQWGPLELKTEDTHEFYAMARLGPVKIEHVYTG